MRNLYLTLTAFFVLLGISCSRQEQDVKLPVDEIIGERMTFKASFGDVDDTRSVFISDEASNSWPIYWTPGDAINIFYGGRSSARFETSEEFTEAAPRAEFTGNLQAATGVSDPSGESTIQNFWAIYPYNENNTCDGTNVTLTIPSEQAGVAGTFANNLNPTVAMSPNLGLSFYNVASWFIFTLTQENVVSATLEGANGETLVGKVKVSMDSNNRPHIDEVTDGKTFVSMTPDEGSFQTGEFYCMVILPGTYNDGLVLTLTKEDGTKATCEVKRQDGNPMVIERSKWARKKKADEGLDYTLALPEAVDLGLPSGLKWASFNLGASAPEEYGDYYAWGETEPYYSSQDPLTWKDGKKDGYSWLSYKWCKGSYKIVTKYCSDSSYGYNGFTDTKTVLDSEDDAASVNLGGNWRMPTYDEFTELKTNCTWEWTQVNGINGRKVTGPNGNSIFLPAAGDWFMWDFKYAGSGGTYWSSSLDAGIPYNAVDFNFNSDLVSWNNNQRYIGYSVRPVYGAPFVSVESVVLDENELNLPVGATASLVATVLPLDATINSVSWSSSDETIARVSSSGVVTAIAAGSAIITVTTTDGGKSATCNVTVTPIKVSSIAVYSESLGCAVTSIDLYPGETHDLDILCSYSNGTSEVVSGSAGYWQIVSENVATCTFGLITASKRGSSTNVTVGYQSRTASCTINVLDPAPSEAIDLGLSVKWGNRNLGATSITADGQYYSGSDILDYNSSGGDVSESLSEGEYRTPTKTEMQELIDGCNVTQATIDGVTGALFTSKTNGNTIFFPNTGLVQGGVFYPTPNIEPCYWTSTRSTTSSALYRIRWYINSGSYYQVSGPYIPFIDAGELTNGYPIRPVYNK